MKELEKTKRISIASVLFILVILIGLLTYKRPKNLYSVNTQTTLDNIITNDYLIPLDKIAEVEHVLIDIRSQFEFEKGHLENAINIYTPEILSDENTEVFNKLKSDNTTVILYGTNPDEALEPYMLLYQLGYPNLKILLVENSYSQNKLITKNVEIEKSVGDVNAFIDESIKKANIKSKPKAKTPPPPKRVIAVKKKKKMPAEGGC
jgi:rhodanese-related sulfurtransferase